MRASHLFLPAFSEVSPPSVTDYLSTAYLPAIYSLSTFCLPPSTSRLQPCAP